MSHETPDSAMSTRLPGPGEIKGYYNRLLQGLDGGYMQHRWGESDMMRRHFRQTERAMIQGLRLTETSGSFLEIGCGPAVWTTLFLAPARSVALVDISEEMLHQARARVETWAGGKHASKVSYSCGDFLELDIAENSFDTIVSVRAFEYMPDKAAFIAKCFRLLRPGGSLLVVTKNRTWHDSVGLRRGLSENATGDVPVGLAMQIDLIDSRQARMMLDNAGFANAAAYPVILGSFEMFLLASSPALILLDLLQRISYKLRLGRLTGVLEPVMESFLVFGRKP